MKSSFDYYVDICTRAEGMGLSEPYDRLMHIMDIECADRVFHLNLENWLKSDDIDFAHDYIGIANNIKRDTAYEIHYKTEPLTDDYFNDFVPRHATDIKEEVYVCIFEEFWCNGFYYSQEAPPPWNETLINEKINRISVSEYKNLMDGNATEMEKLCALVDIEDFTKEFVEGKKEKYQREYFLDTAKDDGEVEFTVSVYQHTGDEYDPAIKRNVLVFNTIETFKVTDDDILSMEWNDLQQSPERHPKR